MNFFAFAMVLISAPLYFVFWLFMMTDYKVLLGALFIALHVSVLVFIMRDLRGVASLIAAFLLLSPLVIMVAWR